jgi:hypothetical protein
MDSAKPGDYVMMHSLQSTVHQNGKTGRLLEFSQDIGRWKVEMVDDGTVVSVKPENMMASPAAAAAPAAAPAGTVSAQGERRRSAR